MSVRFSLSDLLRSGRLRSQSSRAENDCLGSGFGELDEELSGGWPRAGLTELLSTASGIGELRLLAPALRKLSESENRWIVWINPPHIPYAPALERLGIDLGKVLLVFPKDHREAIWAFEQTLATASCSAALGWLSESKLRFADIRRLQLAARKGGTWATLFRPASAADHASPASPRIEVTAVPSPLGNRLKLDIRKRPAGWPVGGIEVELDAVLSPRTDSVPEKTPGPEPRRGLSLVPPPATELAKTA